MNPIRLLMLASVAAFAAQSVGFAPGALADTLVVLNKSDGTVSLLDPVSGVERTVVRVGDGPHEAAAAPDGRTVVVCNYGARQAGSTISVLDAVDQNVIRTIDVSPHRRPHGVVFLRDGERILVTAEANQRLLVVNIATGKIESAIETNQPSSHMVVVTPDESLALVANISAGSVSVIDLRTRSFVKTIETGAGAEGIFAHPTRPEVWVTNREANTVSVIDTRTLDVSDTFAAGEFPIRVAITPDGARAMVSCARAGEVWVYDVASRDVVAKIRMDEEPVGDGEKQQRLFSDQFGESPVPIGILIQPDGKRAYVANTNADVVSILDLSTWKIVGRLRAGREPDGLAWAK